MTTVQLRDLILQKQTLYKEAVRQSEIETEKVRQIVAGFSPEILMQLASNGYNLDPVVKMDVDRLIGDQEYLESVMSEVQSLVERLHKDLEDSLCTR